MAQRVITKFVSDLSGKDLGEAGQTVKFSFLGVDYEVDLSREEADQFADDMDRYVKVGRRVGGRRQTATAGTGRSTGELQRIRKWARENGYNVSDRGRISKEIQEAYAAAN